MTWERIEIEDTSDCATCEKRHAELWEQFTSVRLKSLGASWCSECGREIIVMVEESTQEPTR